MRIALLAVVACASHPPLATMTGTTITSLEPATGRANTRVTIHGRSLEIEDTGIVVYFGANRVPRLHFSNGEILVEAPPGSGTVDVRVAYDGYQPLVLPHAFTYAP